VFYLLTRIQTSTVWVDSLARNHSINVSLSFYGPWKPHPSPLWRTNTIYFICNPRQYSLFI
jgi:hypothetical protein